MQVISHVITCLRLVHASDVWIMGRLYRLNVPLWVKGGAF